MAEKFTKAAQAKMSSTQVGQQVIPPDYGEACSLLTKAIALQPSWAQTFSLRAQCYRNLQEYKKAIFDYTMAIQIEEPKANEQQTVSLRDTEKRKEHIANYYGSRGMCFRLMGKLEDSINDFTRAKSLDKDSAKWYFNLGLSYYDMGEKVKAVKMYDEAIKLLDARQQKQSHFRATVLYASGSTRRELGQIEQSIADLKAACETEDKNASYLNNLGLSHFEAKDYSAAFACFGKAIEYEPKAIYLNNRGLALFQQGKYEEALVDFEEAQRSDRTNANIYFNCGNAELATQRYHQAVHSFSEAIKLVKDDE
eukprot:PhF_6_TR26193/c0_g1_i2/m.37280